MPQEQNTHTIIHSCYLLCPTYGLWDQSPLVSIACLVMSFHLLRSWAKLFSSCSLVLHQLTASSIHSLHGLPLLFVPSTIPNVSVCNFLSSSIGVSRRTVRQSMEVYQVTSHIMVSSTPLPVDPWGKGGTAPSVPVSTHTINIMKQPIWFLCPPSERSDTGGHNVCVHPSVHPPVCEHSVPLVWMGGMTLRNICISNRELHDNNSNWNKPWPWDFRPGRVWCRETWAAWTSSWQRWYPWRWRRRGCLVHTECGTCSAPGHACSITQCSATGSSMTTINMAITVLGVPRPPMSSDRYRLASCLVLPYRAGSHVVSHNAEAT